MIPESQYILRTFIRWLVIALAIIAAIVLTGIAMGRNMWGWIIAYWAVLTVKNVLEYFKW